MGYASRADLRSSPHTMGTSSVILLGCPLYSEIMEEEQPGLVGVSVQDAAVRAARVTDMDNPDRDLLATISALVLL